MFVEQTTKIFTPVFTSSVSQSTLPQRRHPAKHSSLPPLQLKGQRQSCSWGHSSLKEPQCTAALSYTYSSACSNWQDLASQTVKTMLAKQLGRIDHVGAAPCHYRLERNDQQWSLALSTTFVPVDVDGDRALWVRDGVPMKLAIPRPERSEIVLSLLPRVHGQASQEEKSSKPLEATPDPVAQM